MPFVSGFLRVRSGSGDRPDNTLPGVEGPVDPGYGVSGDMINNDLPPAPPGCFPPPTLTNPIVPIPPGTSIPPGTIWPSPPVAGHPLPTPRPPTAGTPLPPTPTPPSGGVITPPIYNTYWMLCYTPNHGWKYVAVDPSLRPDNTLPPTAQPK